MQSGSYIESITLKRDGVPDFDAYPFDIPAIRELTTLEFHPRMTFLIGENGMGKSTLIEGIAVAAGFNPEGGSRGMRFMTRESHSELHRHLRLRRGYGKVLPNEGFFLRAESTYNLATFLEERDIEIEALHLQVPGPKLMMAYGGRSLHEQSHGESFLSLLVNRFHGNGLYLLDEPEAALSPARKLAVLHQLHQLVRNNSQFIIATHSPILLAYPDALILELTEDGIAPVEYEDTEHFRTARDFLNHREAFLRDLLAD